MSESEKNTTGPSKISVQEISLPKGGGALRGIGETFQPDFFSGTGSYSISFPASPARGFEPSLSLQYNSGSGNSEFGLGFSLSLPKISIRTEKGIPKYDGTDHYMLDGGAELVKKLSTAENKNPRKETIENITYSVTGYLPRVEGDLTQIEQWTDDTTGYSFWKLISKDNTISYYGQSELSRIADPEKTLHVFEWLIDQSTDDKGNIILFNYKAENSDQVPDRGYEKNRSYTANRYIHSIRYGNYNNIVVEKDVKQERSFAFEIIFSYGEYNPGDLNNIYKPTAQWTYRPDPFSVYKSGFEIRTCRLCQNILMFHHFAELGDDPCLVKSMTLNHRQLQRYGPVTMNGLSMLQRAAITGYRKEANGNYKIQEMPPLDLRYSTFNPPLSPQFKTLSIGDKTIPGYLEGAEFLPVDLYGDGLPGFLYNDTVTTAYCEPEGNGKYGSPQPLSCFPINRNFQDGSSALMDMDGNGQLELVVSAGNASGYYSNSEDGRWGKFHPFPQYPIDLSNPGIETSDLNANGKTDFLLAGTRELLIYDSQGEKGYLPAKFVPNINHFPLKKQEYLQELVTFADIFGDGLSHRVRISRHGVECWPMLGYGRFGGKVTLGNAPDFGEDFDIARVFLADIDGSGTTGLIYAYPDRIEIFLNESGNSFSAPIEIMLPQGVLYGALDRISFSDILGTGNDCLVFSKMAPEPVHYYYNFVGETLFEGGQVKQSIKPYLLVEMDSNMGATTQVQYCSSTKFALQDKKSGRPWITKLRFPVQVVEKIIVTDKISGARFVNKFKYHDGYYDPIEKVFCGFGYVESWDSETFEEYEKSISNPGFPFARINAELFVPPVYTKTWYHTGAFNENNIISRQYQTEYYQGDKDAYVNFPDSVFDPAIDKDDRSTRRQAFFAMKGQVIRTEVYAQDLIEPAKSNAAESAAPYTVEESNVKVVLLQATGDQHYAVFFVHPLQSISYQYERNPGDPRVKQDFTLEVDRLSGEVLKSCSIFLPRRNDDRYPTKSTAAYNFFINTADTENKFRYRGVPYDVREFEIFGLELPVEKYFSFNDTDPVKSAVDHPIPYEAPLSLQPPNPPGALQARQLSWQKFLYCASDPLQKPVDGELSIPKLLHHIESAVFTEPLLTEVFGPTLTNGTIQTKGGYIFDQSTGYWWSMGLSAVYNGADFFYSLKGVDNTIASYHLNGEPAPMADPSLFTKTRLFYDYPYCFSAIESVQYLREDESDQTKDIINSVKAKIDYASLKPFQIQDINGNISQALFDPLGQVIVTTLFGHEKGLAVGGARLYEYDGQPPEYDLPGDITFPKVIDFPHDYVKKACTFFYYHLLAWKNKSQPFCAVQVARNNFYHNAGGFISEAVMVSLLYSDGFGRVIETKLKTNGGNAFIHDQAGKLVLDSNNKPLVEPSYERWIVSGRSVYDNKGNPCEQWFPYFSNTALFENQKEITDLQGVAPPTVTHYDPLSRVIRVDTPKGFFSKVDFTPWEVWNYDADDTVLGADYFSGFMKSYPITDPSQQQKDEKDALDKAAKFYNTPSITVMNNLGQTVQTIEYKTGHVNPESLEEIVKGTPVTTKALLEELIEKGYLTTTHYYPGLTLFTAKCRPFDPGFALKLDAEFQPFAGGIIALFKQYFLISLQTSDILGRVTESIDPRLNQINQKEGYHYYSCRYRYAMGEQDPIMTDSADSGTQKTLDNIFGNQVWSLSARNYCQVTGYDRFQRKIKLLVKKLEDPDPVNSFDDFNLVEVYEYGETQTEVLNGNLRGQVYRLKDLSGVLTTSQYSMQGVLLKSMRRMAVEYKKAIDWNIPPLLEDEKDIFIQQFTYNAISQVITETAPDGTITTNGYNESGMLNQVKVSFNEAGRPEQSIIKNIEYNASGQLTRILYGNEIITRRCYERTTRRLIKLLSSRPDPPVKDNVQSIHYCYDPVGNITRTNDYCVEKVFNNNQEVSPVLDYTYDPIYRLKKASGRQHTGINANTFKNNASDNSFKQSIFSPLPPGNDGAKLEKYTECYTYDDSGNLTLLHHCAPFSTWNRQMRILNNSNRLQCVEPDCTGDLKYDASGNQRQLHINNPVTLDFNCCENLVSASIIERDDHNDSDYYVYDANEQRTRKVVERMAHGGSLLQTEEKTYSGNYEVKKIKTAGAQGHETISSTRQTLRVMNGSDCVAIIHYMIPGANNTKSNSSNQRVVRFQMGNNLGSVSMEMSEKAELISYEEYFPYGGTAIIAGKNKTEVSLKDYRYSGKECDDSTGLYYYGARYYCPWLGRWLNPDPAGTVDGLNLYVFLGDNPLKYRDADGLMKRGRDDDPEEGEVREDNVRDVRGRVDPAPDAGPDPGPPAIPPAPPPPPPGHVPAVDQADEVVGKAGLQRRKIKGVRDLAGLTPGITLVNLANSRDPANWPGSHAWPEDMKGVDSQYNQRARAVISHGAAPSDQGKTAWGHLLAEQWGGPALQYNLASVTYQQGPADLNRPSQEDYQGILENAITDATGPAGGGLRLKDIRIKHTAYLYHGTNVAKYMRLKVYVKAGPGIWEKRVDQTIRDNAPLLDNPTRANRRLGLRDAIIGGAPIRQKRGTSLNKIRSEDTPNIRTL